MNQSNNLEFLVNGYQIVFDTDIDEELAIKLKTSDAFTIDYLKQMVRLNMLDVEGKHIYSIIRVGTEIDSIIYEDNNENIHLSTDENTYEFDSQTENIYELDNSQSTSESQPWSDYETRFILDKYEKYLNLIGPMKKFKTKKCMWIQISKELEKQFNILRTPQQTENRYKTILKRKKKATNENRQTGNSRQNIQFEEELNKIAAIDDSLEPHILRGVNCVVQKKVEEQSKEKPKGKNIKSTTTVLRETLLEINKIKEEGRERRHREKMDILNKLIDQNNLDMKLK